MNIKENLIEAIQAAHDLGYAVKRIKIADVELDLAKLPRELNEEEKEKIKRQRENEALAMRYAHTGIVPRSGNGRV